jgi:hypothetical protein
MTVNEPALPARIGPVEFDPLGALAGQGDQ